MRAKILIFVLFCAFFIVSAEKNQTKPHISGTGFQKIEDFILVYPTPPPFLKKNNTVPKTTLENSEARDEPTKIDLTKIPGPKIEDENENPGTESKLSEVNDEMVEDTPEVDETLLEEVIATVGFDLLEGFLTTILKAINPGLIEETSGDELPDPEVQKVVVDFIGKILLESFQNDFNETKSRFVRDTKEPPQATPFTICHKQLPEFRDFFTTSKPELAKINDKLLELLKILLNLKEPPSLLEVDILKGPTEDCPIYKAIFQSLLLPEFSGNPLEPLALSASEDTEDIKEKWNAYRKKLQGLEEDLKSEIPEDQDFRVFLKFQEVIDDINEDLSVETKMEVSTESKTAESSTPFLMVPANYAEDQDTKNSTAQENMPTPIPQFNSTATMPVLDSPQNTYRSVPVETMDPEITEDRFGIVSDAELIEPPNLIKNRYPSKINPKNPFLSKLLSKSENSRISSPTNIWIETSKLYKLNPYNPFLTKTKNQNEPKINPDNPFLSVETPKYQNQPQEISKKILQKYFSAGTEQMDKSEEISNEAKKLLDMYFPSKPTSDQSGPTNRESKPPSENIEGRTSGGVSANGAIRDNFETIKKLAALSLPDFSLERLLNTIPGQCRLDFIDIFSKCEAKLKGSLEKFLRNQLKGFLANFS